MRRDRDCDCVAAIDVRALSRTLGQHRGMRAPDQIQPGASTRRPRFQACTNRSPRPPSPTGPFNGRPGTDSRARSALRGQAKEPAPTNDEKPSRRAARPTNAHQDGGPPERAVESVQLQRRDRRDAPFPHSSQHEQQVVDVGRVPCSAEYEGARVPVGRASPPDGSLAICDTRTLSDAVTCNRAHACTQGGGTLVAECVR